MNTKAFRYYLFGSVLTIVVLLSAAELLTRTISWISGKGFMLALYELEPYDQKVIDLYQWHPFTGIMLRPNTVFRGGDPRESRKSLIVVDRHGFLAKDQTLSLQKAANEIRIAAIGGSTTANVRLGFYENWPGRLGTLVQEALVGTTVSVINAGTPGFHTAQSITNLALRVMPFNPDVVIIYHAYNDLKAIRPGLPFKPDYSHIHDRPYGHHKKPVFLIRWLNKSMFYVRIRNKYRDLSKFQAYMDTVLEKGRLSYIPAEAERAFEQHLRTLVAIARGGGAKVVLSSFATLHDPKEDYYKRRTIDSLSQMQKSELYDLLNFTPGLNIDGIFEGIRRYNGIIRKVAQEQNTGWVDNANKIPHRDEYFMDRVHFSRQGAARMAENLLPIVLEQLRR